MKKEKEIKKTSVSLSLSLCLHITLYTPKSEQPISPCALQIRTSQPSHLQKKPKQLPCKPRLPQKAKPLPAQFPL